MQFNSRNNSGAAPESGRQADGHDDGEALAVVVLDITFAGYLAQYARALMDPMTGIPLSTRRVRLNTVRNCFSGTDACGWIMANLEGVLTVPAAQVPHCTRSTLRVVCRRLGRASSTSG